MKWSRDEIIALASDETSFRTAEQIAHGRRWLSTGRDESCLWGEYPGSGRQPYRVLIRMAPFQPECDCPSRKRPCKHSLGLLLMAGGEVDEATGGRSQRPEWVVDLLAVEPTGPGRIPKSGQLFDQTPQAGAENGDERERRRVKRMATREGRVADGLRDLESWLIDLVRTGLAAAIEGRPGARLEWEEMAARLVDAQAQGLARRLRRAIDHFPKAGTAGDDSGDLKGKLGEWQGRLLDEVAMLFLAIESYRRHDNLTVGQQSDLRNCIGWVQQRRAALDSPAVNDEWEVQGQSREVDERLVTRRTWLAGRKSGRIGLLIDYAVESGAGGAADSFSVPPGFVVPGDLHYFPSAMPLRGVLENRGAPVATRRGLAGSVMIDLGTIDLGTIDLGLNQFAVALAANPWIEVFPIALARVVPARVGDGWLVVDSSGLSMPLRGDDEAAWRIAALSGGEPIDLFGEWDGRLLRPLTVVADGRWSRL